MSLAKIRQEFRENYFINISQIWKDYNAGYLSIKERDEQLEWYRDRLNQLDRLESK